MKIRHLRIRINTEKGLHGVDIDFPDGLVIIRADNSMGKSTCIQSILVALGLEAMITTSQRDLPLPHVMKEELESNGKIVNVLESDIFLEIENKKKETIVVHRTVKGSRDKDLITVIYGPALSDEKETYRSEDFFVSRPGSATRERGFHKFLAGFLGWNLPEVQTYDGKQVPLYLQCIFPYFAVEQKRGWASLLPPIPTQYRIRDPHKRIIEFLLDLDAYKNTAKRIELSDKIKILEISWSNNVHDLEYLAKTLGGIPRNVPQTPTTNWPPEILPSIQFFRNNNWFQITGLVAFLKAELTEQVKEEIPIVSSIATELSLELSQAQEELNEKEVVLSRKLASLEMDRGEVRAIEIRLDHIEEDIIRNKDARTIESLGSFLPHVNSNICPTCNQHIEDTVLPLAEDQKVMSLDDNISFLEEQHRTFIGALRNTKQLLIVKESQIVQMNEELNSLRLKIRTIKNSLSSDGRLPSMEAIRKRIEIESEIFKLNIAYEKFQSILDNFEPMAIEFYNLKKEKESLPKEDVSESDKEKILKWNEIFINQLIKYDFQSLDPDTIKLSNDTFAPVHEGFDLPSNISASDFIRIIWSYLTALLGVAHEYSTNHPSLLIFDEPKQQSAKNLSFEALLDEVSESKNYNQQVIFATSESLESLDKTLQTIPHTLFSFEGRIIKQI